MNALLIFITMCKVASIADNRVEQSIQGVGTEVLQPKMLQGVTHWVSFASGIQIA